MLNKHHPSGFQAVASSEYTGGVGLVMSQHQYEYENMGVASIRSARNNQRIKNINNGKFSSRSHAAGGASSNSNSGAVTGSKTTTAGVKQELQSFTAATKPKVINSAQTAGNS